MIHLKRSIQSTSCNLPPMDLYLRARTIRYATINRVCNRQLVVLNILILFPIAMQCYTSVIHVLYNRSQTIHHPLTIVIPCSSRVIRKYPSNSYRVFNVSIEIHSIRRPRQFRLIVPVVSCSNVDHRQWLWSFLRSRSHRSIDHHGSFPFVLIASESIALSSP